MVKSLKKLNEICQKPHYKKVGNWMVRHILRPAALPMTWLLLHTPITAHQVTLASIVVGVAGIYCFSLPGKSLFLAGCLLLQFWYYLDHVDGQIARYRGTSSLTGRFFDYMMHHFIHGIILFSLGYYLFATTGHRIFLAWGFAGSVSTFMFNLIYDAQYKTFFERLAPVKRLEINRPVQGEKGPEQNQEKTSKKKPAAVFFSLLHKSYEIHVIMNILTLAAFLQAWFSNVPDLRPALFAFYGLAAPLLAVTKISYWIRSQKVDREFESNFRVLE